MGESGDVYRFPAVTAGQRQKTDPPSTGWTPGSSLKEGAQEGELKLVFLPPYSPELNPDELIWRLSVARSLVEPWSRINRRCSRLVRGVLPRLQRSMETVKRVFHESSAARIRANCGIRC